MTNQYVVAFDTHEPLTRGADRQVSLSILADDIRAECAKRGLQGDTWTPHTADCVVTYYDHLRGCYTHVTYVSSQVHLPSLDRASCEHMYYTCYPKREE